jgi:hypothetical protein
MTIIATTAPTPIYISPPQLLISSKVFRRAWLDWFHSAVAAEGLSDVPWHHTAISDCGYGNSHRHQPREQPREQLPR